MFQAFNGSLGIMSFDFLAAPPLESENMKHNERKPNIPETENKKTENQKL